MTGTPLAPHIRGIPVERLTNNPPSVKEAFYLRADARYASLGPSVCCAIIVFQAHIASQSRLTAWSIVLICPGAPDS